MLTSARAAGEPGAPDYDQLADNLSDQVSLASNMSAYTDRSTAAGSTQTSGSSASTLGGRGGKRAKRKGKKGKIRQGTPEEEQKLCTHVREIAPTGALCTQVRALPDDSSDISDITVMNRQLHVAHCVLCVLAGISGACPPACNASHVLLANLQLPVLYSALTMRAACAGLAADGAAYPSGP